jgi:hypothetical protein
VGLKQSFLACFVGQPPGGPAGAGGAAGSVYKWLGLEAARAFPPDVVAQVTAPGDAAHHAYPAGGGPAGGGAAVRHVIHAVEPDLRKPPPGRPAGLHSRREAVDALAHTYAHVLAQFARHCAPPPSGADGGAASGAAGGAPAARGCGVLRLLPVSGGLFAGPFLAELPQLTAEALAAGFEKLPRGAQAAVLRAEVHLCVFAHAEGPLFEAAGFAPSGPASEAARAAAAAAVAAAVAVAAAAAAASAAEALPPARSLPAAPDPSTLVPPGSLLAGWTVEAAARVALLEHLAAALEVYPSAGRPLQRRFLHWALASVSAAAAADVAAARGSGSGGGGGGDAVAALSALVAAMPAVCRLQFRIAAAVFPPQHVHGVLTALVDRLVSDAELGFEAKAADLLLPLAKQVRGSHFAPFFSFRSQLARVMTLLVAFSLERVLFCPPL